MATFNLQSVKDLFKNKYALAGVAVAAGAGGYVLWKKSRAGGQGDAASTATGVTGVSAGGTADTTGTDVATWLGSYSTGLQNMLQEQFKNYGQTLNDALKGITPTTPTPTTPTSKSGPHPVLTEKGDTWATLAKKLFGDASLAGALKGYNRANTTYAGPNANNKYAGGSTFKYHTVIAVPWNVADLKNYSYVP